jgi:tetratricopeptide (TPR) repeat protein
VQGTRDVIYVLDQIKRPVNLKEAIDFVRSEDPATKLQQADNASFFPSRQLVYPVDKAAVLANNVIDPKNADSIVSQMNINLTGNYLTKDELMILDIIANNNWKRPIYFAITVGRDKYLNLQDYFQTEGFAYRLVPIKTPATQGQVGSVRTDVMYNNIINKFRWGNMNDPKVYLDENNIRMSMNVRNSFVRLADGLLEQGKRDSAIAVLDRCNELVPNEKVPYNYFNLLMVRSYYQASRHNMKNMTMDSLAMEVNVYPAAVKKANEVVKIMANNCEEELKYYFRLEPRFRATIQEDLQRSFYIMQELSNIAGQYGEKTLSEEVAKRLNDIVKIYQPELAAPQPKK